MDIQVVCLVVMLCVGVCQGYSSGAPTSACDNMVPAHGAVPQTLESPFTITLSTTNYSQACLGGKAEGFEKITVTLGGKGFEGFFCQARPDPQVYATSGTLAAVGAIPMTNKCDQGGSITHKEKSVKSSVDFTWTPAKNDTVYIVCTFVEVKTTYWVKQVSDPISYVPTVCSGCLQMRPAFTSIITCLFVCIVIFVKDIFPEAEN